MRIKKIKTTEEFDNLKDKWDELLEYNEVNTFFLSFDWVRTWWKYHGKNKELFILLAVEEDIVGIAPLMKVNGIFNRIRFIGYPESDYADFIIRGEKKKILKSFFDYIFAYLNLRTYLCLEEIPGNSSTLNIYGEIAQGWVHFPFSNFSCEMELEEEIIKKVLNKKQHKKKLRRIERAGTVVFEKGKKETLQKHIDMHTNNWQAKKMQGIYNCPEQIDLFNELIKKKVINIWVLSVNGMPICTRVVIEWKKSVILFVSAMDEKYKHLSPGIVSIQYLIQLLHRQGYGVLDFSRGLEKYKEDFATKITKNMAIEVHSNVLTHFLRKGYNTLKESIMCHPELHQNISYAKQKIKSRISKL